MKPIFSRTMLAVAVASTLVACSDDNPAPAATSDNTSVIGRFELAAGPECINGGLEIYSGIDANKDGILNDSEKDMTTREVVCSDKDIGDHLARFATAPLGAEFTGMYLTDNNFFMNIQHPSNQDATVFVSRGDMNNVGDFDPVPVPTADAEKELTTIAHGTLKALMVQGDAATDGNGSGSYKIGDIIAKDGTVIKNSNDPDFNAFIPTGSDDSVGYLFTNWEDRPGSMSRAKVSYSAGDWTVSERMMLDFSSVEGTWVNCFGTVSPWGTPLSSEELYFDDTAAWNNTASAGTLSGLDTYLGAGDFPNPYRYGYIVEITEPTAAKPVPVKWFTLGRYSHENAVVMPDQKTVYLSDDGSNVVFFKFIADTAGDLSAGALYAAKVTQDAGTDPATTGFDLVWVELAHGTNSEIASWVAEYDSINSTHSDSARNDYISDTDVSTWAAGNAADNRVAFLESRKAAVAKGATAEFNKMEGTNINVTQVMQAMAAGKDAYMYMAMSDVTGAMSDGSGDIAIDANRCGVVYQMKLDADYNVSRMEPAVVGGPYNGAATVNQCSVNSISSPDNLVVLNDGRVIIGEDTGRHENNMMWVYNPQKGTYVIQGPSTFDPASLVDPGLLSFESSNYSIVSVASNNDWEFSGDFPNAIAEANGYGADAASDDWLVSNAIDLTGTTNPILRFNSYVQYGGGAIDVLVATTFDGSTIVPADWTSVATGSTFPADDSRTVTASDDIDLSAYVGQTIYVAFQYTSTGTGSGDGALWQIQSVFVGE